MVIQRDAHEVRLSALHYEHTRLREEHERLVRAFRYLMRERQAELDLIRETTVASIRRTRGRQRQS